MGQYCYEDVDFKTIYNYAKYILKAKLIKIKKEKIQKPKYEFISMKRGEENNTVIMEEEVKIAGIVFKRFAITKIQ